MSNVRRIAIYGAGGFAREVAWLADSLNGITRTAEVLCFVDDNPENQGEVLNEIPIWGFERLCRDEPDALVTCAVGNPQTRKHVAKRCSDAGFRFLTLRHPNVECSRFVDVGIGSVICAGTILTVNINIGSHVHINLDCTIGHDCIVGDYTTLAPGVHVSGWVSIGELVYIGTGASIINGKLDKPLVIGNGAVIGAGACVTRSLDPGVTAVGVPARAR